MKNKFIFSLVSFLIFSKPLIGQEKEELISLCDSIATAQALTIISLQDIIVS